MPLASPSVSLSERLHVSLQCIVDIVNKHVSSEDYAVVILRSEKNSDDVVIRGYLRCDREEKAKSDEESFNKRISDFIRLINCLFGAVIKLENVDNL